MKRRDFAKLLSTVTFVSLAGCLEDDYEISTEVVNTHTDRGRNIVTIRGEVENNTDWDETLEARIQFEWEHEITTEEWKIMEVSANNSQSFSVEGSHTAEFIGHDAKVGKSG